MNLYTFGDPHYIRALSVTLRSALANVPSGTQITVGLDGVSRVDRSQLERIASWFPSVEVVFFDTARFDRSRLSAFRSLSTATYLRLFVGDVLPDVARVLVLDSDVLIRRSLEPLLELDLSGRTVAAARDMVISNFAHPFSGIPTGSDEPYFNAGVMVVDLDRWRDTDVKGRVLDVLRLHPEMANLEQDALNIVLARDWIELDMTWNAQGGLLLLHEHPDDPWKVAMRGQRTAILTDPAVVHFSGIKPWRPSTHHPFSNEWRRWLRACRLRGYAVWAARFHARRLVVAVQEMARLRERRER
jgi:lipopolysaccharide biosynthesis glycosyltransferase